MLAQQLAQVIDKVTKGRSGNAIANESFIIPDFDIVTVDFDGRQVGTAMGGQRKQFGCLIGHTLAYVRYLPRASTLVATISFALLHNPLSLRPTISR